jgi:hypothetical protein
VGRLIPSCYPQLVHHPILRPGTIGTVGTMVPTCVGDRENRGPSDHVRTIFYMSRATPEKRKEWPARHGSRIARHQRALPSPTGTMVLTVPTVPRGGARGSEFGKSGLGFRASAAGTISPRRSRQREGNLKGFGGPLVGAPRELFVRVTPGSIGVGSRATSPQPAVVATAQYSNRSYLRPLSRRGLCRGSHRGSRRAARAPLDAYFGPSRAPGPIAVMGIIVGGVLLCFRFTFDR